MNYLFLLCEHCRFFYFCTYRMEDKSRMLSSKSMEDFHSDDKDDNALRHDPKHVSLEQVSP